MKLKVRKCKGFSGKINLPGDKSITHRGLMIASFSKGKSSIKNPSRCMDCLSTMKVLKKSGINIRKNGNEIIIDGKGFSGFKEPSEILDCENSGTTMRLMSGIFSSLDFKVVLTGDSSLRKRPMDRIIKPLRNMGAEIAAMGSKGIPPLIINGKKLKPYHHILKIASAQVKSAIIFAALNTEGKTIIKEPFPSRDHTERMLELFGANIEKKDDEIIVYGKSDISGTDIRVPADISSASYFIALAILTDRAEIILKDVGINPTRTGFLDVLKRMGANIIIENKRIISNEPVGDIIVKGKQELKGIQIEKQDIPRIIDELPLLAIIATQAKGTTVVKGAEELRVKESDRIETIAEGLRNLGAKIEPTEDGFIVEGETTLKGSYCESYNDHRIAMSLAVAGLIAKGETVINNADCINISFPGFINYFKELNCERIIGV